VVVTHPWRYQKGRPLFWENPPHPLTGGCGPPELSEPTDGEIFPVNARRVSISM